MRRLGEGLGGERVGVREGWESKGVESREGEARGGRGSGRKGRGEGRGGIGENNVLKV